MVIPLVSIVMSPCNIQEGGGRVSSPCGYTEPHCLPSARWQRRCLPVNEALESSVVHCPHDAAQTLLSPHQSLLVQPAEWVAVIDYVKHSMMKSLRVLNAPLLGKETWRTCPVWCEFCSKLIVSRSISRGSGPMRHVACVGSQRILLWILLRSNQGDCRVYGEFTSRETTQAVYTKPITFGVYRLQRCIQRGNNRRL
jgi:hypothetical protein